MVGWILALEAARTVVMVGAEGGWLVEAVAQTGGTLVDRVRSVVVSTEAMLAEDALALELVVEAVAATELVAAEQA